MKRLNRKERMRLMKFVCSFAWADLEVQKEERALVSKMVKQLGLDPDEIQEVERWLKLPPRPEEVDPAEVPLEHRQLFLDAARKMIEADGQIAPEEKENFRLFEALLK